MTPTYETTSKFDRDYDRLSEAEKEAFRKAVSKLVEDLHNHKGFRKSLRVKGYQGQEGIYEMTWAANGRALFMYGRVVVPGEPHVLWLRIGGHEIF